MNKETLAMVANFVAGAIVGFIAFLLKSNEYSIAAMVAVGIAMKFASEKIAGEKKDFKWWVSNGGFVYIFIWFVAWVLFLNL